MTGYADDPALGMVEAQIATEDAVRALARRRGTGSGTTITAPTQVRKLSVTADALVQGTRLGQVWWQARMKVGEDVVLTVPTGTTWTASVGTVTDVAYP